MDYYTALRKQSAEDLERKIRDQDKLIEESAQEKNKAYRTSLEKMYRKKQREQNAAYLARNTALNAQLFSSILYAAIVTLLAAVKSERFLLDLEQFITKSEKCIINYAGFSMKAGWKASGICDQISNVYIQDVLSQLTTIVIAAALIVLPAIIAFYLMKKYIKWYKEEICDNVSLWAAVLPLALTVFLAEEIHGLLRINLITVNLFTHLIYTGISAYIQSCRKNRG